MHKNNRIYGWLVLTVMLVFVSSMAWAGTKSELVVAAWGDPYEAEWRKSIVPAFEKKFGVRILWDVGYSTQTLAKLQAQKANPQIDVALFDIGPQELARRQGLIARLDPKIVTNLADMHKSARLPNDEGVAFGLAGTVLYYNSRVFKDKGWSPPTSWLDVWDPRYKGHVLIHSITNGNGLNFVLAVNKILGGSEQDITPGLNKIKTLVPHVITFDKVNDTPALMQQGEAWIGTWGVERIANMAATGVPVAMAIPKEGAVSLHATANVVKGAPNERLAQEFINMMIAQDQQEFNAKFVGYGPLNVKVRLDPDTAKKVIYGEAVDRVIHPNWKIVNDSRAQWTERWNKEVEAK